MFARTGRVKASPVLDHPALPPVRRHRLELDLARAPLPGAELEARFGWRRWRPELTPVISIVLHESFRSGLDAALIPALATLEGSDEMVRNTAANCRFIPEGAWLIERWQGRSTPALPCGAILCIEAGRGVVQVQTLGVLPEFRGRGLGRALLVRALRSCRALGCQVAQLDVTACNRSAGQLYRSLGFRVRQVFFRRIEAAPGSAIRDPENAPRACL
ncbi:MAG: GNAT family N-acetyltransferase [Planctomyces sp.]|nr:GNAT family N-acetyltransferase [Planctomyces sp.]